MTTARQIFEQYASVILLLFVFLYEFYKDSFFYLLICSHLFCLYLLFIRVKAPTIIRVKHVRKECCTDCDGHDKQEAYRRHQRGRQIKVRWGQAELNIPCCPAFLSCFTCFLYFTFFWGALCLQFMHILICGLGFQARITFVFVKLRKTCVNKTSQQSLF